MTEAKTSSLLSALLETPANELATRWSNIEVGHLAELRALLHAGARMLRAGEDAQWWRLEAACRMMEADPEEVHPEEPTPIATPEDTEPDRTADERTSSWPPLPERLDSVPPAEVESDDACPSALLPVLPIVNGAPPERPSAIPRRRRRTDDPGPDLELPNYAALCAACGVFPERQEEIERRYGILDEHDRKQLHGRYRKLFALVREEEREWERLVARYVDWQLDRVSAS